MYDRSVFPETLVTELDLVCEDSYKADFLGTVIMIGLMIGCFFGGDLDHKIHKLPDLQ